MKTQDSEAEARAHLRGLGVSRETMERLEAYADLLRKWTQRVNLVSPGTLGSLWSRHILDSAQLCHYAPDTARLWLDFGSGGGLPGVVCAILAADRLPQTRFRLVESDRRKCAFLATCVRELDLPAEVEPSRVENLQKQAVDVISARAVASLSGLFALAEPFVTPHTVCLFPKGARYAAEIATAQEQWRFTVDALPSITDPAARILRCHLQGRSGGGRHEQ